MLSIGIITSDSADNKLYYEVNQRYEHYVPLRAIFADEQVSAVSAKETVVAWRSVLEDLPGVRLVVLAGVLVQGSASTVDILVVGNTPGLKLKQAVKTIEASEGREINYSLMSYDEFYYRLSVRDKFITEILAGRHTVVVDTDNILKNQ
jgi:hypothetical protein